ncbi:efflux RND transporter periplasmic adaptor subunit [Thalassotalea nanhaiensis]|uniref:Efflux RND transporter periplasmic adaptor subunit n=1 Tax=Thalassotalea nanhaiensis TaxID=3065648 RepID=A0ABY9TLY9_9GAMM|nr:efflux RND transporter periplasmic adaptor subunit [Colwelliaceae bacterium SQ345]
MFNSIPTLTSQFLKGAIAATLLLSLLACGESVPQVATQTPYYHKAASEPLKLEQSYKVLRRFSGTLVSKQSANLNFEVSGRVANIFVDEGDTVTKGQLLASLDTELLGIEQQQLVAQESQLKAELELAQANLNRVNELIDNGYASQQNQDELQAQKKVLEANKKQLQASQAINRYQINHTEIYAPFTGTINKRNINVGEVINPQVVVFTLQEQGNNELKVGVPQNLIADIKAQNNFSLSINQTRLQVTSLAVNSEINQYSRTVQLRFSLPNDLSVFNNQMGYFEFEQHYQQQGFWVPTTALTDGIRGTWNVYTLEKITDDSSNESLFKLISNSVEIIHSEQDKAFIRGSLTDGQRLLTSGLHRLVPGQLVRI